MCRTRSQSVSACAGLERRVHEAQGAAAYAVQWGAMASEIELGGRPFNDSPSRRPPHLQRNVTTAPAGSTNGKDRSPDRTTIGRCPPATFTTSKTFDPSSAFRKATLGGSGARGSPDGDVIYYRSATHLMAAALSTRGQVDVVRREQLFADIYSNEGGGQTFDGWLIYSR